MYAYILQDPSFFCLDNKSNNICMYVIPLKRSVSRQLVACVKGPKSGSKRRQIAKTSQKSKVNFSPNRKCHFFVPASLKFFSRHDIYMFIFVIT